MPRGTVMSRHRRACTSHRSDKAVARRACGGSPRTHVLVSPHSGACRTWVLMRTRPRVERVLRDACASDVYGLTHVIGDRSARGQVLRRFYAPSR